MKKSSPYLIVAAVALLAGGSVAWWKGPSAIGATAVATAPAANVAPGLWQASFNDLQGKSQPLVQWRGKPMVLNFWATWCAPCREEMPEFVETQKALGDKVRFVGLAIDNPADVQKFVKELGIAYPVLVGEQTALELMRAEGNNIGALPFTLIYDAQGNKVAAHAGRLDKKMLAAYLDPLT
ncbi:TlpA family protein disulfide reductase [Chitinimonas sp. BJB300]|uniref:TlpA family protein disulfide reductase n=1 Tax=Chitinimonas sp. BJB300 TaxID=1559339 RepID=UPI000C11A04B|nr:TlpA disulfide reductase family protein [Chitinimonas sp. BJB300]PHV13208.1 thioredoxin [Chitinimonas sp. BJB300]TSJ89599.1 TlpA family protein disulfide reductase [Chitinimonas sp. BJB300]